jgi:hypothetical protein
MTAVASRHETPATSPNALTSTLYKIPCETGPETVTEPSRRSPKFRQPEERISLYFPSTLPILV